MKSECAFSTKLIVSIQKVRAYLCVCGTLFEIYSQKVLESLTYVSCGQKLFS